MLDNLPIEIVTEILFRLPVKSLLCFQTVCKQWQSIISDPHFATTHANHAPLKVIVLSTSSARSFGGFLPSVNGDGNHNLYPAWQNSIPFRMPTESRINSVTSCNGLLCLQSFEGSTSRIILWNPSIRKFHKLREHHHISGCFYHVYGMGFDSINNDYKVLEIEVIWRASQARYCSTAFVFSMKCSSWETISSFPYYIASNSSVGAWTNGLLHFIARKTSEASLQNTGTIIAFNLATNKTCLVPLPEEIEIKSSSSLLTVLHGCLCVVDNCSSNECYNVWRMEDYGVKSSWTALAAIPYSSSIGGSGIYLFEMTRYEELVLSTKEGQLRLYDPKQNRAMHVVMDETKTSYASCLYTETLVWLIDKSIEPETMSRERKLGVRWFPLLFSVSLLCVGFFFVIRFMLK